MKKLWLILIVLIIAVAVILSILFLIPEKKAIDCRDDDACYENSIINCIPSESTFPETENKFKIIGKIWLR